MKKALITVAALLLMSAGVSAQVENPISLYVGGAISIPNSPEEFSEAYNTGFHGSVGLGLAVMPSLQVVGKVEYHRFGLDVTQDMEDMGVTGGHNNMWMYGADARHSFGLPAAPIKPFLLGGVGFARISASDLEGTGDLVAGLNELNPDAETNLYLNLGGGVELKTGPMFSFFGQVRYVTVDTDGESSSFIPVTLGLKFF